MTNQHNSLEQFSLEGRVALVTGSSRGIGLALARALGGAGATVVLNARDSDALDAAATRLRDDGIEVAVAPGDVTDPEVVRALIGRVETDTGPIEILVNNAGIQRRSTFVDFSDSDWDDIVRVNLTGPFLMGRAVAKPMVERGRGKIINIASVNGQLGRPTIAPYSATKGGLRMLTQGMCADLGPSGVQVNALAPGYFATELTQALVDDDEFSAWLSARTPAGRWGDVDELGGAAVFLASDASNFVNGQTLFVDGGMTAVV